MPMSMSGARAAGGWGRAGAAVPVISFPVMVAAHSTEGGGLRPAGRLARTLLLALAASPAFAAPSIPAPPAAAAGMAQPSPRWLGIERRIERDYFQQDSAALEALAAQLAPGHTSGGGTSVGTDPQWRGYYTAFLAYRLALLAKDDEDRAWPFAQQCVDSLNRVLVLDTGSAEALALQAACLALQSDLDPWRSPLAAPLSLSRIDKALKLAPDNPRVLLLGALSARDRPRLFGGDDQQAFRLMQRAVTAFERHSAQPESLPGWGAADAFTDLARDYLGLGETLQARNVLERALLIAPDIGRAHV